MIEVKMKDLVANVEVLKKLAEQPLKGRVAYNIGKILQHVENEINLFAGARNNLIQQYVEKDENGEIQVNPDTNEFVFKDNNMQLFIEEINKLLETPIEINANKISLDDLNDINFTPAEILALEAFIIE